MAITNGYVTLDEAVRYIGRNDARADSDLEDVITSVSRLIDQHCQTHFYQISGSRYFATTDLRTVVFGPFNPLVSATTIKFDIDGNGTYETTLGADTYQLLSSTLRPVSYAPTGRPYGGFRMLTQAISLPLVVPSGRLALIEVTGTWGWPGGVPPEVRQAAKIMVAEIAKLADAPMGVIGGSDFGVYRVSTQLPVRAQQLLAPYRHPLGFGLA